MRSELASSLSTDFEKRVVNIGEKERGHNMASEPRMSFLLLSTSSVHGLLGRPYSSTSSVVLSYTSVRSVQTKTFGLVSAV